MIRCEHCGSTLPDGAIFCGECGRAVTAAASRRPVATTPIEQAPPPPLQQPDLHGRRQDPAAEAWLPESTLDPATRAWLTGAERGSAQQPPAVPVQRPDDLSPRTAPSHVHGAGTGLPDWSGQSTPGGHTAPANPVDPERSGASDAPGAVGGIVPEQPAGSRAPRAPEMPATPQPPEPPLDPNAYPSVPAEGEDPEVTRLAERSAQAPEAAAPRWSPPTEQPAAPAPSGPSWWVGRSGATNDSTAATGGSTGVTADPTSGADRATDDRAVPGAVVSPPQPGDTAVVEPLADRRPPRPAPLVTPGSQATTCHVCGNLLEPDDIFCAECGAVRPAVTAAFTGPIVPLPMARPDWAADDSQPATGDDAGPDADGPDNTPDVDTPVGDAPSAGALDGAAPDDDGPSGDAPDAAAVDSLGSTDRGADGLGSADRGAHGRAPETDATDVQEPVGGTGVLPTWVNGGDAVTTDDAAPSDVDAAERPRGLHAAPDAETPVRGASFLPPVPGSATVPSSAPSAADTGAIGVPSAAPLPPLPGVDAPALPDTVATDAPTSADGDLEDDVDETRIVSATPTHAPFVLHFSTGERFGVHGTGLVGRLPRPQPGERFDDLLTVHDPGKSVSKTHLELGRDGDDLWVSDRFSGNGTVVRHIDGSIRRCEPGRRYRVERGARVDIGEQFFLVQ